MLLKDFQEIYDYYQYQKLTLHFKLAFRSKNNNSLLTLSCFNFLFNHFNLFFNDIIYFRINLLMNK
jgi:hypothetical protein